MGKLSFVIAIAISLGIGSFIASLFNSPPFLYAIIIVLLLPVVKPIVSFFLSGGLFRNKVSSMESVKLIAALGGHDPKLREKAVRELRKRAPETQGKAKKFNMIDLLVNALKDEDKAVRQEAASALGKQGWKPGDDTEKFDYLIAKQEWDELVKMGKSAVELLITALKDEDSDVRWEAAEILGKIKDPRAVESLITALKDKDSVLQGRAVEALEKIGKPAVEPLITALKDEDSDVRWRAAEILGKIKDPRAVESLIAALKNEDLWARRRVAEALGGQGWKPGDDTEKFDYLIAKQEWDELVKMGKSAVEPLITALNDKDPGVRWEAVEALGEITGKNFGEDPKKWQGWWEQNKKDFLITNR